jgi:hypothetical protein
LTAANAVAHSCSRRLNQTKIGIAKVKLRRQGEIKADKQRVGWFVSGFFDENQ